MASEGTLETGQVCASHPTGWRAGWRVPLSDEWKTSSTDGLSRKQGVVHKWPFFLKLQISNTQPLRKPWVVYSKGKQWFFKVSQQWAVVGSW